MNLLLANDDGVNAPGLATLAEVLAEVAKVHVVAPLRDHSGASNSLTLDRPLRPMHLANGFIGLDGTPTDCVHLGLNTLFEGSIDRVISGINTHANLGDDVIYSGTVAAAMEGRFLDAAPIAVSLVNQGHQHYDTAAEVARRLVLRADTLTLGPRTLLNVNVPDVPWADLQGFQVTRLGHRAAAPDPDVLRDPRGRTCYWIAAAGRPEDAGPGTDFHAVAEGYVSITPLHVDMTRFDALTALTRWVESVD